MQAGFFPGPTGFHSSTDAVSETASIPVTPALASKAFNNSFTAYAKAINKAHGRTGALFQHRFGRIPVASDRYSAALVRSIHHNPRKHGFVEDFRDRPCSSYQTLMSDEPTPLARAAILDWFGRTGGLQNIHAIGGEEHKPG
jgi:putative transposase